MLEPVAGGDPTAVNPGMLEAVDQSRYAMLPEDQQEEIRKEEEIVKKAWEEYNQAREFDKFFRQQVARDRRYAAGTADLTWAVDTNLIGAFIDILVSFLYARDPEVDCKKAPKVNNSGTKDEDAFAKTAECVVSDLWRKAKLKKAIRKQVRSTLSTSEGWFKAILIAEAAENPQHKNDLNDLRDNVAKLEAIQAELQDPASTEYADNNCKLNEYKMQVEALEQQIEATVRKYMAIDFVSTQDIQVSLDVSSTEDYLDADWIANQSFVLKSQLKEKFPRLTDEDVKTATCYYRRQTIGMQPLTDANSLAAITAAGVSAEEAEEYTKVTQQTPYAPNTQGNTNGPEFARVVESWDKRDNHIKTMIDGVKRWAKEPFIPAYASSRFYPYFRLSFFETDGARHPQSLSWRLHKLQNEYSSSRSNWRLARERGLPGIIFDESNVSPDDARKIQRASVQELIGLKLIDPNKKLTDCFASKPYEKIDPRMYENSPILADMEKISGVQEALQSSTSMPKTATQAEIEQSGFASRTTADRDSLEDLLTEFAQYTLELSLNKDALTTEDAQRIAGADAFWPAGMDLNDLLTMVEIEIKAGTTGKPNDEKDKQAWGVILPVIKEAIIGIYQALAAGQLDMARSIANLVKQTMTKFGDDTDPDEFLPQIPDAGSMQQPIGAPPPAGPGVDLPPGEPGAEGDGAPALENPTLEQPQLEAAMI